MITRIEIQIMRALAIVMVVIHHILSAIDSEKYFYVFTYLNGIHVYVFFMILGFLFQRNKRRYDANRASFIKKKMVEIGIPYVFWSILLFGVVKILSYIPNFQGLIKTVGFEPKSIFDMMYTLITFEGYYIQLLWYLYALLIFFIIDILVIRKTLKLKYILVGIFLTVVVDTLFPLPFILTKLFLYYPIFHTGRWIEKNEKNIVSFIIENAAYIICILVILEAAEFYIASISGKDIILKVFNRTVSTYLVFARGSVIYLLARQITHFMRIQNCLQKVGNFSQSIYLMHQPYLVAIPTKVLKQLNVPDIGVFIIVGCMAIGIPILVTKHIIMKNKWTQILMLGNNRKEA